MSSIDRSAVLAELHEKIRPTALAAERTLPVPQPLFPLFPLGGLVRGSTLALGGHGATSVGLGLFAELTRRGHWLALVGLESLGWSAATESGVALRRAVAVRQPPTSQWATVVAALLDAVDVVVVDPRHQVRAGDDRRLLARARERGAVLVRMSTPDGSRRFRWPSEADLTLTASTRWEGLGPGRGRLDSASIEIASRSRRARPIPPVLVVLGSDGAMRPAQVEPAATRLRRVV